MDMELLKINGLTYSYPGASVPALADVSCTIRAGECICLTGDSGCGKTTLLLAIKGLLRAATVQGPSRLPCRRAMTAGPPRSVLYSRMRSPRFSARP